MPNIAIANFSPKEVFNSNWPRFVGWQVVGVPPINSRLFGLIDANTRMHAFFKDTTIGKVLRDNLNYSYSVSVNAAPLGITYEDGHGQINMPLPRAQDHSVRCLPPYQYINEEGTQWEVYVIITGEDLHICGTANKVIKSDGYWDMGIWCPVIKDEGDWTDTARIEQATINHVYKHGYVAKKRLTMFKDNPNYGKYIAVDYSKEIPPRS